MNNKKTVAENNKKKQSQGTLQAVPITRNNRKNTIYRGKYQTIIISRKQGKIEEILIRENNAKIQIIRNNTRNNNHMEQYQNTTYREQ